MENKFAKMVIRALLMGFLIYIGYNLAYYIAPTKTSTAYRIGFVIWGYITMLLGLIGFLSFIKNNYFPKKEAK